MEPINGYCGGDAQCAISERLKFDKSVRAAQHTEKFDIENQQHDRFAALEYFLETWPEYFPLPDERVHVGDEVNQLNVSAVLFKAGYWADIHISAAGADVGAEKLENLRKSFRTILATTQVVSQQSECR